MKVLVSAATRHGSTADIAATIVRVMRLRGLDADEIAPQDVDDVTGYDAFVLGSAVYAGHWTTSATSLVNRCAQQFAERPVWLFSSGPIGQPPTTGEMPHVSDLLARTHAREHRVFSGRLDRDDLELAERDMMRAVRAPDGDYREWPEIVEWAAEIADSLVSIER